MTAKRGTDKRARQRAHTVRRYDDGRGAPTKFTAEARATILGHLRIGGYVDDAAAMAGVSDQTVYEWIARGAEEEQRRAAMTKKHAKAVARSHDKKLRAQNEDYLQFKLDVGIAQSAATGAMLASIAKVAVGGVVLSSTTTTRELEDGTKVTETVEKRSAPDWQAAAWRLERRLPKKWGREQRVEMTGTLTARVDHLSALSDALDRLANTSVGVSHDGGSVAVPAFSEEDDAPGG